VIQIFSTNAAGTVRVGSLFVTRLRPYVIPPDISRPDTASYVDLSQMPEKYAGKDPEVLRNDFLNSLLAAYRPAEIMAQLVSANMEFLQIEIVSDRHFIVFGSIN
jgi:hypothetical protein